MLDAPFLAPGVHADIPEARYHADTLLPIPTLSSTLAKLILDRSPLHAWTAHPKLNPAWEPTESATFDIGRAAHRAVLGKGGDYVAYPAEFLASNGAASTRAAKEWAEEQRAAGRTPLKADVIQAVEDMAVATRAHLAACGIVLDPARSEVTAIAEIDGVMCRARVDNAPDRPVMLPGIGPRKVIVDFKSCEVATPEACRRSVEGYSYDVQKQHYSEVWAAATGEDRAFLFVFTEKSPPHGCCILWLLDEPGHSADWLDDAREKVAAARATWGECLTTGHWPGYPQLIVQVGANSFHRQKWQDTQQRAAVSRSIRPEILRAAMAFQAPERTAQ